MRRDDWSGLVEGVCYAHDGVGRGPGTWLGNASNCLSLGFGLICLAFVYS